MKYLTLVTMLCLWFVLDANAQWMHVSNPLHGGHVDAVVTSGNVSIANANNRIFVSSDDGVTWLQRDSTVYWRCTVFSGSDLFVGTEHGVLHSTDFGATWNSLGLRDTIVNALLLSGADLYAGTNHGVFYSSDKGNSWSADSLIGYYFWNILPEERTVICLAMDGNRLYVGTNDGVDVSTDKGRTWVETTMQHGGVSSVAISGNTLFVGKPSGEIWYSIDSGKTWKESAGEFVVDSIKTFVIHDDYMYAGVRFAGILRSTDQGRSWDKTLDVGDFNSIGITANGTVLAGSTMEGLYRSTNNGMSWTAELGFQPVSLAHLTTLGHSIFSSTAGDNETYLTTDYGEHWSATSLRHVTYVGSYGNRLIAAAKSYENSGYHFKDIIYLSTNGGLSWRVAADSSIAGYYAKDFVHTKTSLFALSYKGVLQSLDSGETWKLIKATPNIQNGFLTLAASDTNLFVGSNFHKYNYRSTNNGLTWSYMGLYISGSSTGFGLMAVTSKGVFANIGASLYRSSGNDTNWVHADTGLNAGSLAAFAVSSDNIFAATNAGVFVTTNSGHTWSNCSTGLTDLNLHDIAVAGEYLFAVTNQSVWRRPLSEMISQSAVHEEAGGIESIQVYPNPATSELRIQGSAIEAESIQVFDMLGRRTTPQPPPISLHSQEGEIALNVRSLPVGMYFVKISGEKILKFVKE